jgi:flavodoxin I
LRILVTYYSDTGNTEKVAKAIYDEVSKKNITDLKKAKDVKPEELGQYDLVFLGSPCHMHDLSAPAKKILAAMPNAPKYKLAGFVTHAAVTSEKHDNYNGCFTSFQKACKEKQIGFSGIYDCRGVRAPYIQELVRKSVNVSDAEWDAECKELGKHPSSEDLLKAKEFAKKVLLKV